MTFFSQMSPDITEPIPTPMSSGGNRAASFAADDRFDCTINGMAFNFRIKKDLEAFWYQRASTTPTKQQIDTNVYAGEASLSDFWIRSQTSWHNGAGVKYYGPGDNEFSDWRYRDSLGIDPWTEGEFKLLHDCDRQTLPGAGLPVYASTYVRQGEFDGFVLAYQTDNISYVADGPVDTTEKVRTNYSEDPDAQVFNWSGGNGTTGHATSGGPFNQGYAFKTTDVAHTWANFWTDADSFGYTPASMAPGDRIAVSAYMRHTETNTAVTGSIQLSFRDSGGSQIAIVTAQEISSMPDNEWIRLGGVVTVPDSASSAVAVRVRGNLTTTANVQVGATQYVTGVLVENSDTVNDFFSGDTTDAGGHVYAWTGATDASSSTDTYTPATFHFDAPAGVSQPAVVGDVAWFGHDAGILRWDMENDILSTPWIASSPTKVWWVKGRLFAAVGQNLYWINHLSVGTIESDGLVVATGPTPTWRWTDVSQTADAILLAGSDGVKSSVSSLTVSDDESGLPVFTGAREVAEMPPGETIRSMFAYLSTYIILATSGGIRIGLVGDNGTVQYGPHTVSLPEGAQDVSCRDRFAYVAVTRALPDDTSGVVRIDLSAPIADTGRYAFAWDISSETFEDATTVAFYGRTPRVVYGGLDRIAEQQPDRFVSEGYLDTGRIRFATGESKDFQKVRVAGETNGGGATIAGKINGSEVEVARFNDESGMRQEINLGLPGGPLFEDVEFRTYLRPREPEQRNNLALYSRLVNLDSAGGWGFTGTATAVESTDNPDGEPPTGNGIPTVSLTATTDCTNVRFFAIDVGNPIGGPYVRITPGIPYVFSIWARMVSGGAKTVEFVPTYRTDDDTSSTYPSLGTQDLPGDGEWHRLWIPLVPPNGFAFLGMEVVLNETLLTGEEIAYSSVMVEQTETLGDYFDGYSPNTDGIRYSWDGITPLTSTSTETLTPGAAPLDRVNLLEFPRLDPTNTPWGLADGTGSTGSSTSGGPLGVGYIFRTWTTAPTTSPTQVNLTGSGVNGIPVTPGQVYTLSAYFQRSAGSTATDARCDIVWNDSTGTLVHNAPIINQSITVEGEWVRVSMTAVAPVELIGSPQNEAVFADCRLTWSGIPTNGDTYFVASAMFEEGVGLQDYFDGGFPEDTAEWDYSWDDVPLESTSSANYVGPAPGTGGWDTPVVESITVKATPAPKKARLVKFPLQCFDFEQNRYGEAVGYDGFTIDRLQELEALDVNHAPVFVVDRRFSEAFTGTIESLEFLSLMNPDGENDNVGGEFNVTVRVRE